MAGWHSGPRFSPKLNGTKTVDDHINNTKVILRELGHSEDEIFYIVPQLLFFIHALREPYKRDAVKMISDLYNKTRADTLAALGYTEEQADARSVALAKGEA